MASSDRGLVDIIDSDQPSSFEAKSSASNRPKSCQLLVEFSVFILPVPYTTFTD